MAKNAHSESHLLLDVEISVILVTIALIICWLFFGHLYTREYIRHVNPHDVLVKPRGLPTPAPYNRKLKIPIVMYHYVEYTTDPNDKVKRSLTINPYTFEQELKALQNAHFETYYVKDVPAILNGTLNYSTKSAILTFDDGYEDFYKVVLPLLKKFKVKATFYVINNFIGRTGFVTQKELEEIRDSGFVEIGAHTMDHAYLKGALYAYAKREIEESKADLEKRLGIKVMTLAYPFGAFSPETVELTKQATFSAAVSVIPGAEQSNDNLFYLYRIRAGHFGGENIVQILENWNTK